MHAIEITHSCGCSGTAEGRSWKQAESQAKYRSKQPCSACKTTSPLLHSVFDPAKVKARKVKVVETAFAAVMDGCDDASLIAAADKVKAEWLAREDFEFWRGLPDFDATLSQIICDEIKKAAQ